MQSPIEEIENALEELALPNFINRDEIKQQYYFLAKKYHPDVGGSEEKMESLNHAYAILIDYIDNFRYVFDKDEIVKQFSGVDYVQRFKS
jgi:DnaJ-class molecular chaperone